MGAQTSNNNAGRGGYYTVCVNKYIPHTHTYRHTVSMARSLKAVKFNLENRSEFIRVLHLQISCLSSLHGSWCVPWMQRRVPYATHNTQSILPFH